MFQYLYVDNFVIDTVSNYIQVVTGSLQIKISAHLEGTTINDIGILTANKKYGGNVRVHK